MRRGAKSKLLEPLKSAFNAPAIQLQADASIANCHNVGRGGQAATGPIRAHRPRI